MSEYVVVLSIPGLRAKDVEHMPHLAALTAGGDSAPFVADFPAVTWPVQASMLTGKQPAVHGVTANGFYWREKHEVEMWTAWNEVIQAPQIWDILHAHDASLTSAVWFPMLSKGCGADYICMPAPVHNPDGSESLWCYTKPESFYGELRDAYGHFPLKHFWGPLASIASTDWIVDTAIHAARRHQPNFFFIYLPHLDYAAQKDGPDSPRAQAALGELDNAIGRLVAGCNEAYAEHSPLWLAASEYVITEVDHVAYPNRLLRDAGFLKVKQQDDGEHLDCVGSEAWALVDHQFSHVYLQNAEKQFVDRVANVFRGAEGMDEVLVGDDLAKYGLNHQRSGEIVLVSSPRSWQAYYWWLDDAQAPAFSRTVDIHRKPGYDPVELHFDFASKSTPLDASLVKGSHGAPPREEYQRGVLLSSQKGVFAETPLPQTDLADIVLRQFGI